MYTEIHRSSFVSTGQAKFLSFTTDVDWINVYNFTKAANQTNNAGIRYYWQRGMAEDDGFVDYYNAASTAINYASTANFPGGAVPGFTLYDSSVPLIGPAFAVTAISNANPPVVTHAASTAAVGDVVRLSFTGPQVNQFGGLDFTIGIPALNTTFPLAFAPQIVAGAGMAAFYRKLLYTNVWYPGKRVISKCAPYVANTNYTIITMTVTHRFQVGEKVRIKMPIVTGSPAFGMTELNNVVATVVAINQADADGVLNTIVIDVNSTGYAAFNWPLTALDRFSLPEVLPIGIDSKLFPNDTRTFDAFQNTSSTGIILGAGLTSPAGMVGDLIYYTAGKSNL